MNSKPAEAPTDETSWPIRPARAGDAPALAAIFRRAALSNAGDRATLLAHPEALVLPAGLAASGRATVATAPDGSIVGFASVRPIEPSGLELDDLFVEPSWMRRGVGRALVQSIAHQAAVDGVRRLEVTGNDHAHAFYRAVGFVPQGRVSTELGAGARLHLALDLDPDLDLDLVDRRLTRVDASPRPLPGHETMISSWRALAARSPGAHLTHIGPALVAVFPDWLPLNNAVLPEGTSPAAAAALAVEVAGVYRGAGVPAWALWAPHRGDDLDLSRPIPGSAIEGLRHDTTTLVMELQLDAWAADATDAGTGVDGVVRTTVAAAADAGDEPIPAADLPAPERSSALTGWAAVRDGQAVAGAWSLVDGTDCGVYAVGTAPQWRRRGVARGLMRALLADARARGARTATLQSTPMGVPLYRSLGFEPRGRYDEWVPVAP